MASGEINFNEEEINEKFINKKILGMNYEIYKSS